MSDFIQFTAVPNQISDQNKEIIVALISGYPFDIFDTDTHENQVLAYGPSTEFNPEMIQEIEAILTDFTESVSWDYIEKENWNEQWEKNFFEPISIGNVHIRAPFHPQKTEGIVVTIEPKMSFGTGHHATTQGVIEQMLQFTEYLQGKKVLDMGTGTGILAIVAEKLGASEVLGIEIDDWVVDNANENIEKNICEKTKIECGTAVNLQPIENNYYDTVIANIHREVILEDLPEYARVLKSTGLMLISGIQPPDYEAVTQRALECGLQPLVEKTNGEWGVLGYLKK